MKNYSKGLKERPEWRKGELREQGENDLLP